MPQQAWYHKLNPNIVSQATTMTDSALLFKCLTVPGAQECARALAKDYAGVKIHRHDNAFVVSLPVLFRGASVS